MSCCKYAKSKIFSSESSSGILMLYLHRPHLERFTVCSVQLISKCDVFGIAVYVIDFAKLKRTKKSLHRCDNNENFSELPFDCI